MNNEYEVCRIAVECEKNCLGEFEKNLMNTIQHADKNNMKLLFQVYPTHVEAHFRRWNHFENELIPFEDSPDWYMETEIAFWHDQEIKEQMAVDGFYDSQGHKNA